MTEIAWGPSNAGSVVLDLGADVGALILDTPAELAGREIEISPAGDGAGARRTHAQVRERRTGAGTGYAAVYPGLPAAEYTVWKDAVTPAATVTVLGGQVARCHWPG
ncbi:MAG: hypothetical protein WB800_42910 [Streptosporangiaceae bacterium]